MNIVPDTWDSEGNWVRSYYVGGQRYTTKADVVWKNILARCIPGGPYQTRVPSYVGCTNGFADFQEFASWATLAVGYGREHWVIDKDLLAGGRGKVYSAEVCLFIPREINSFLTNAAAVRGDLPVGVVRDTGKWGRTGYMAQLQDGTRRRTLGRFHTAKDAFSAYKEAKEARARQLADHYAPSLDARAVQALRDFRVHFDA